MEKRRKYLGDHCFRPITPCLRNDASLSTCSPPNVPDTVRLTPAETEPYGYQSNERKKKGEKDIPTLGTEEFNALFDAPPPVLIETPPDTRHMVTINRDRSNNKCRKERI